MYCITEKERKGSTAYIEFQKGHYDGQCWKEDSLLVHCDVFEETGCAALFKKMIPGFDYYGITWVSEEVWEKVKAASCNAVVDEIDAWAEGGFTVLGL